MGTYQHRFVMKRCQLFMIDGAESQLLETRNLLAVMDDIAQAIERFTVTELFLCLSDGTHHSRTKATKFIDCNPHSLTLCIDAVHSPLQKQFILLGDGQIAIVKQQGIIGLAKRGNFTMRIDIVSFLDIL